jgi:Zn-dependent M16 (insulinase) family peptidase
MVVNTRLRARFDEAGWAGEQMGGLDYLFFVRRLADDVTERWAEVREKLQRIQSILVNRSAMIANVTLDAENWQRFRPQLEEFNASIPAGDVVEAAWTPEQYPKAEGLTFPAQVNFVGKGACLYDFGYHLHGSMSVISNYVGATWMWDKVRVQGGAYGGMFTFDSRTGVLTFLSYRDPNLLPTLDIYDRTGEFLRGLQLSQEELTKAIVGAIGELDAYQLPDAKGFTSLARYLTGDTDEFRQNYRNQVLSTTVQDFHNLAQVLDQVSKNGEVVVLGSPDKINEANSSRQGWLDVKKVL